MSVAAPARSDDDQDKADEDEPESPLGFDGDWRPKRLVRTVVSSMACSRQFGRREGRELLGVYVKGQLSDVHRKTAEGIALRFGTAPQTLQRFLESIKWDEEKLRD